MGFPIFLFQPTQMGRRSRRHRRSYNGAQEFQGQQGSQEVLKFGFILRILQTRMTAEAAQSHRYPVDAKKWIQGWSNLKKIGG